MFGWLVGKHVKKEMKNHLHNLHLHLSNSFSNIKEDITSIHTHLNHKDKKLIELEGKIALLENKLLYFFQEREKPKEIEYKHIEEDEEMTKDRVKEMVLLSLTFTQRELLRDLYDLKTKHNRDIITLKNLAKFKYPGRDYDSVRTTLSEYLHILLENNLINKDRIGRKIVVNLTKEGQILAKEILKKEKKKKEKLKIKE